MPRVLVARGSGAVEQAVDGDTVVYVASTASMVLLNAVATQVWLLLDTPQLMTDLVEKLAAGFHVDAAQVARDLETPFATLVESGVLTATVLDDPSSVPPAE